MNTSQSTQPRDPQGLEACARILDTILGSLLAVVAAHFRILAAFTVPAWNRISRTRQRLASLLARIAAGTYPAPRTREPTLPTPRTPPRPLGDPARPPPAYLSRARLWLVVKIGYPAAGHGSQLQHLLNDPATRAALESAPPHALAAVARALRPLCRSLGVTLPPELQPAPDPLKPPPVPHPWPLSPGRRP